jgi:hypothetical protein
VAHHAILVAISWYPGLTELKGPEHDVEDMRRWLRDPQGGGLDDANIVVIKSGDFPRADDRFQAQPAEVAFKRALTTLLFAQDGVTFKNRVGERLYLFFAGHGFASKRLAEAALFTAQASKIDPDHIASKRYAEKIANSGAFDEIVLIMDCCRDVDLSDSIRDPVIKVPDRQGLARTLFFEAYGAGRGQQAREREMAQGGPVRGLFTYALVDALRNAKGNDRQEVTGAALKGYVLNRWPQLFEGAVPYEPDIAPPAGARDIVFARRGAAAGVEVRFILQPPVPAAGSMIVIENGSRAEVARVPCDPGGTRASLADGLYKAKLDGTARTASFDASGESVEVSL